MQGTLETHRSFVNTWECDENAHMNVQFYLKRFDEAARIFLLLDGKARGTPELPRDRHIRYHAELHAGATTVVHSAMIDDGPLAGRLAHFLLNGETGRISATCLDDGPATDARHKISAAEAAAAIPRTATADRFTAIPPSQLLAMGGAVSHRSMVLSAECSADGPMAEQGYVARLSDAAPFAWGLAGIGVEWLDAHGFGRVAVEMKITRHGLARAGEALVLYSAATRASGKTVTLRHEMLRMPGLEPIASAEVIALVLDLSTRRPVDLPQHVL